MGDAQVRVNPFTGYDHPLRRRPLYKQRLNRETESSSKTIRPACFFFLRLFFLTFFGSSMMHAEMQTSPFLKLQSVTVAVQTASTVSGASRGGF